MHGADRDMVVQKNSVFPRLRRVRHVRKKARAILGNQSKKKQHRNARNSAQTVWQSVRCNAGI